MIKLLNKWLYLGYDKKTFYEYSNELEMSNLNTLKSVNLILSVITAFIVTYFYAFEPNSGKCILLIIGFFLSLSLYIVANDLINEKVNVSNLTIGIITNIFLFYYYFVAIYVGTFGSENNLAVTAICLFIFFQIIFTYSPIKNIFSLLPYSIFFIFFSYNLKTSDKYVYDFLHLAIAITIGLFMSWNVSRLKLSNIIINKKLENSNSLLYYTSITDSLTGISNRMHISGMLKNLAYESKKNKNILSCIIFDIDCFKAYNDYYGHPKGDEILIKIGNVLKNYSNISKVHVGRIGGEEFMVVWNISEKCPEVIAEEIRTSIENLKIEHERSTVASVVTVSVGLFSSTGSNTYIPELDLENAYKIADNALYMAKKNGKNCCWKYDDKKNTFAAIEKNTRI